MVPPERRRRQLRCGHEEVEPSAFPLVSAAHEFKTPLVVMLGYTDLLLSGHLGAVNQRQKQVLGEIQEGAQRLQKLIQDLLLLQELKAGRGAAENLESADVNENVGEIFNYWSPTATQKRIRYQFRPSEGNQRVRVEPLKLQHIVSNLIENALKHTPEHGLVIVSVTPCFWERRKAQNEFLFNMERKESHKVENAVRIDVSDTGPGIRARASRRNFWRLCAVAGRICPRHRARTGHSPASGGSARRHDLGGKRTRKRKQIFLVVIPGQSGDQVTSAPNILLVDDEPSVLRYTKTLLEIENYHVETAASGEEALQRMNRGPAPNLIVLDLVMPGMDGLQTLESCKKLCPEQKIVMISCVNDTNKVVQAIKLGASDYVTKPFLPPQLQGAVRRALEPLSRPKCRLRMSIRQRAPSWLTISTTIFSSWRRALS